MLTARAQEWLRTHHQTITDAELKASGIGLDVRERLVAQGYLVRIVDGAYTYGGMPETTLLHAAALCTSRPHLVVSGPTAGWLWGFRRCREPDLVHVLAPPASHPCRESWVSAYRTALVDPEDIVHREDGIVMTSPPRTVIDLMRHLQPLDLLAAMESSLASGLCTDTSLDRVAERLDTPGRPWVRRFRRLLACRTPGAATESGPELDVYNALTAAGLIELVRQHWVQLPDYGPARYDLAIPALCWGLEVDIHPEHRTVEGQRKDQLRDQAAERAGWKTKRVGELAINAENLPGTVAAILEDFRARRQTHGPAHSGRLAG